MLWPFIVSFMLEAASLGLTRFMSWKRVYHGQIIFAICSG
jgi:hypothetical protein